MQFAGVVPIMGTKQIHTIVSCAHRDFNSRPFLTHAASLLALIALEKFPPDGFSPDVLTSVLNLQLDKTSWLILWGTRRDRAAGCNGLPNAAFLAYAH